MLTTTSSRMTSDSHNDGATENLNRGDDIVTNKEKSETQDRFDLSGRQFSGRFDICDDTDVDDADGNVEKMSHEFIRLPNSCLFCLSSHQDEHKALDHMRIYHGFTVPNQDRLHTDLDALLSYVSLVINRFHACIFCGVEKRSSDAVRTHMIAKGHCMLDMSATSDFIEFWDVPEDTSKFINLSHEEYHLGSGINMSNQAHGHAPRRRKLPPRRHDYNKTMILASPKLPTPHDTLSPPSSKKSLVARDAMGLIGLSPLQRRSLAVTQKKIMAREQRHRNEARWTLEKLSNKVEQKHFKPDVPGRKNG